MFNHPALPAVFILLFVLGAGICIYLGQKKLLGLSLIALLSERAYPIALPCLMLLTMALLGRLLVIGIKDFNGITQKLGRIKH